MDENEILDLELDVLFSVKDLRERLPISHTQINRMVAAKKFPPPIYIGSRPFWARSHVQRYIGAIALGYSAEDAVRRIH